MEIPILGRDRSFNTWDLSTVHCQVQWNVSEGRRNTHGLVNAVCEICVDPIAIWHQIALLFLERPLRGEQLILIPLKENQNIRKYLSYLFLERRSATTSAWCTHTSQLSFPGVEHNMLPVKEPHLPPRGSSPPPLPTPFSKNDSFLWVWKEKANAKKIVDKQLFKMYFKTHFVNKQDRKHIWPRLIPSIITIPQGLIIIIWHLPMMSRVPLGMAFHALTFSVFYGLVVQGQGAPGAFSLLVTGTGKRKSFPPHLLLPLLLLLFLPLSDIWPCHLCLCSFWVSSWQNSKYECCCVYRQTRLALQLVLCLWMENSTRVGRGPLRRTHIVFHILSLPTREPSLGKFHSPHPPALFISDACQDCTVVLWEARSNSHSFC